MNIFTKNARSLTPGDVICYENLPSKHYERVLSVHAIKDRIVVLLHFDKQIQFETFYPNDQFSVLGNS
jgi:hypothetical protein